MLSTIAAGMSDKKAATSALPGPTQTAPEEASEDEEDSGSEDSASDSDSDDDDDDKLAPDSNNNDDDTTTSILTSDLKVPLRARKKDFTKAELGRKTKKLVATEKHTEEEREIINALNSHDEGLCFRKTTFRNLVYEIMSSLETEAEQFKHLAHCTLQQVAEEYVEDVFNAAVQDGYITNLNIPIKKGIVEAIAKNLYDKHKKIQMDFMDEDYEQTADEDEAPKDEPPAQSSSKQKEKKLPKKDEKPVKEQKKKSEVNTEGKPEAKNANKKRKAPEPKEPGNPGKVTEGKKAKKKADTQQGEPSSSKPPKKKAAKKDNAVNKDD